MKYENNSVNSKYNKLNIVSLKTHESSAQSTSNKNSNNFRKINNFLLNQTKVSDSILQLSQNNIKAKIHRSRDMNKQSNFLKEILPFSVFSNSLKINIQERLSTL